MLSLSAQTEFRQTVEERSLYGMSGARRRWRGLVGSAEIGQLAIQAKVAGAF